MRTYWQEMPMLRILLALIAGIGLQLILDEIGVQGFEPLRVFVALLLIGIITTTTLNRLKNPARLFRLQQYQGLALILTAVSFGYILTWFYADKNYSSYLGNNIGSEQVWTATITEPPVTRNKVIMAVADVQPTGRIQLSFIKDSTVAPPVYGDVVLFKAKVEEVAAPLNPAEFNYKRYQHYRNIYNHAFIPKGSWKLVEHGKGNFFLSAVYRLRDRFLHVISLYVKDKNDFAVASAIMLGYRDYINSDVLRAYSGSGVIHVLSVSGLHVTVLFLMLNFLLQQLDERGRKWAIAKAVFIISFIWFYACLTGLSPPVLRSALMFTLIQLGQLFFKNKNTINLVAGSAVLLLLFDPFLIMDVGFQLSYLAVFGIVYLYPKIYALLAFKNWLLDKGWAIVAVSLAAQVATVPLSLFYFHQFPNLFLLANLVVIPLSDLILWTGTALFTISPIPFLNDVTGWLFSHLIAWLNKFIFMVDKMPFALIKGISLTLAEVILVYLLLALLCWLSEERKTKVLLALLAVILTLSSFHSYRSFNRASQKQIVVYAVRNHQAIALINGFMANYYIDDSLLRDEQTMRNKILPYWWQCGITNDVPVTPGHVFSFGKLMFFEGRRILLVDETANTSGVEPTTKLKTDLVILSSNAPVQISGLKKYADFDFVVADGSNSYKRVIKWSEECKQNAVRFWDVSKNGAYLNTIEH